MRPLVQGLEPVAEFVYVDAPSLATGDFGWWHRNFESWGRTGDWIASLFQREPRFDGVFGFSQGAALTSLLVGLRAPDGQVSVTNPLSFDFAVMVGGFRSVSMPAGRSGDHNRAVHSGLLVTGSLVGIPTSPNVHQIVQGVDRGARIVYVDNDPIVLAHARALLTSTREGRTAYIDADLRQPDDIKAEPVPRDTGPDPTGRPDARGDPALRPRRPRSLRCRRVFASTRCPPAATWVLSHVTYDFLPPPRSPS
jgi:hypothetical protein